MVPLGWQLIVASDPVIRGRTQLFLAESIGRTG